MRRSSKRVNSDLQQSFEIKQWLWICNPYQLSDEEIDYIREKLLVCTIQDLADRRTSTSVVTECWDWVMSDDIHPFSFRVCCDVADLDYLKMREALVSNYRRLSKHKLVKQVDLVSLKEFASA